MYSLYALLGRTNDLEPKLQSFASAHCLRLDGGISMVALAEDLVSEVEKAGAVPGGVSVAGEFEFLSPGVEAWAQAISADTALAYIETEYVGGEGFERAGVWSRGTIALGPFEGAGSINQALRALGVHAAAGIDEFEFVGLGRHRSLDEWLQDAGRFDSL